MAQIIKTSTAKAKTVEVLPYHRDAFQIARTAAQSAKRNAERMVNLAVSRYGAAVKDAAGVLSGGPTFEQYRADRAALAYLARDKGLEDKELQRAIYRPYADAIKATYGALPEAQTAEAIAKRAKRAAEEAILKAARERGELAGDDNGKDAGKAPREGANERTATEQETVESIVTRVGLMQCLTACINILEADDSTKAQAVHLRKMAAKAAEALAKGKAPNAPKVPAEAAAEAAA